MPMSMYRASVPVFLQMLPCAVGNSRQDGSSCRREKNRPAGLLRRPPLSRHVSVEPSDQIATDFAKGACARLAGVEPPKYADTEKTFDEIKARIAKTMDFIKEFKPSQIDGSEERDISLTLGGQPQKFKGETYLIGLVLPNFFFHVTTAYAILRHNGVELGKQDFMRPPG